MGTALYLYKEIKKQNETSAHPFYINPSKQFENDLKNNCCVQTFGWQYFYQDLWGAKKIYQNNPNIHWDVGSTVFSFISHLLSFRTNINLIDIRPLISDIDGVNFVCADATLMNGIEDESILSLSALCSIEHFGLGRYGDTIDPDAWHKALLSFQRVLKPGGHLYLSVPIANRDTLCFNAHRMFHIDTIINTLAEMKLYELSTIINYSIETLICTTPENKITYHSSFLEALESGKLNGSFGLFEFIKPFYNS